MITITNPSKAVAFNKKPSFIVYVGLFGSAFSLVIGILIGLSALAQFSGYGADSSLAFGILFHPDIMIYGVLGGLLITEKLENMEKFRVLNTVRISRLTILSLYLGVVVLSAGYLPGSTSLKYLGLALIMFSGLLFLYFLTSSRGHGVRSIRLMFGASIASMVLTAFANLVTPIWMNVQLSYLALLFPIIYIMAERVELGFVRGMGKRNINIQAILSWTIVFFGFAAIEIPHQPYQDAIMATSILLLFAMIISTVRFDPSFRKSPKKGRFQDYMKTGIILAYFWLFLGLFLFLIQLNTASDILDAAAHSIALGFIGTFIVAHSPIIFPMILKKNVIQNNVTFLPLIVITIANVMRVFGDLGTALGQGWNVISYASGYVLIFAILAFFYNLRRITEPPISVAPMPKMRSE